MSKLFQSVFKRFDTGRHFNLSITALLSVIFLLIISGYLFRTLTIGNDLLMITYSYNKVLWLPALLFLGFSMLYLGRFETGLLAFIPLFTGWIILLELMVMFDLELNLPNLLVPLFLFVSCSINCILIVKCLIWNNAFGFRLNIYRTAIIQSALTVFVGIALLFLTGYTSVKLMSLVIIIGVVSTGVLSLTLTPFIFKWLTVKRGMRREMPISGRSILTSSYSFAAFLIGSLYHSILGTVFFTLTRPTDRKKLLFHKSLAFTAGFVVKRLPDVRTRVINTNGEDFVKPSVIISNHQSHIDLMLIMMLSPRIVVLTNEWVWNSPFYGSIVKNADFYPVINGIEGSIGHLSMLIEKGYSIMIFPEGTRSEDCLIKRFHRGAFYLAEQLKLDILPVMIHGMGHVLPKTDFLLRKGAVTVEIFERITPENKAYGETYTHRAKFIRKMYIARYNKIASEIETPDYFSNRLFHNYIYKGAAVTTQVKIDLERHGNYTSIIEKLPDSGNVMIIDGSTGAFPLLLSMVKPALSIDVIEEEKLRIALAEHCVSSKKRITYISANPLTYHIPGSYDVIVLVDYLSLSDIADQKKVIQNCVNSAPLVIISDIKYSRSNIIRQILRGVPLLKRKNYPFLQLDQLSQLSVNIIQKDNIFALSGAV